MNANPSTGAKKIPFRLERADSRTFVEQTFDGMRHAILGGYYAIGETLPPGRQIASELGVSRIVVNAVIARLAAAGLIVSRPRVGCVVLDSKAKRWNGRVNFVYRNNPGSYYPNFFASELARRLLAEGYACSSLAVVKNAAGAYDFSILEQAADRSPDLTVLLFNDAQIERRLSRLGNPFAVVGKTPCTLKGCVGNVRLNRDAVVPEFVMQCRINGVRSVLQVGQIASDTAAVPALRAAGVRASEWVIEPEVGALRPGSVERAAYAAFSRRLKNGCGWLPEVLFFTDDYTARGALSALLEHGVGIPGDVGVVTWSNLGNEIAFGRELSTMQMNPIEHGGTLACCMMSYLRGRGFPADIQIGPTFRPGASFPVSGRSGHRIRTGEMKEERR